MTEPLSPAAISPAVAETDAVRTIVLLGPNGSGTSTLVAALLRSSHAGAAGIRSREPSVQGPIAVTSLDIDGVRVTLLDPTRSDGVHLDPRIALIGADAALFVISAVEGLDVATRLLWQECEAVAMPRVIVLTHVDDPQADVDDAVAACQGQLGEGMGIHALHLPMLGDEDVVAGLIDLVRLRITDHATGERRTRPAEDEHLELVEDAHTELIEAILAEAGDDALLSRFIAGDDLDADVLVAELHAAVTRGHLHPILVSATTTADLGVTELAEIIVRGFPSPGQVHLPMATSPSGDPRDPLSCSATSVLCAAVLGLAEHSEHGQLAVVRVFSGTLRPDSAVVIARQSGDDVESAGQASTAVGEPHQRRTLYRTVGAELLAIPEAVAGNIVLVAGLQSARPGDTVSSPDYPLLLDAQPPAETTLAESAIVPQRHQTPHRMLPIIDVQILPRD